MYKMSSSGLPFEIIERVAIEAGSLHLAYLIRSEYAAKHIPHLCKHNTKYDKRALIWKCGIRNALSSRYRNALIRQATISWSQDSRLQLLRTLQDFKDDSFLCMYTWELTFRLRKVVTPTYQDKQIPGVLAWLNCWPTNVRGRYAALWTGLPWCDHCYNLLTKDTDHKWCEARVALHKMTKWRAALNPNLVIASFIITLSKLVTIPRDSGWYPRRVCYSSCQIQGLLNLNEKVTVFEDVDGNWAFISDTYQTVEQLETDMNVVINFYSTAGIECRFDVFDDLNAKSLHQLRQSVSSLCSCGKCHVRESAQAASFHRPQIFIIRIKPLGVVNELKSSMQRNIDELREGIDLDGWYDICELKEQLCKTRRYKRNVHHELNERFHRAESFDIPLGLQWAGDFVVS